MKVIERFYFQLLLIQFQVFGFGLFALHLSATQLQPRLLFGKSRWQLPFGFVGCAAKILFGGWLIPFALLAWKFG